MKIVLTIGVIAVLGIVLYLVYNNLIGKVSTTAVGGDSLPSIPSPVVRVVGDASYCGWLNGTYPKLKTKQFSDIDGARDNPQALADWQKNNCDLINY